jgi:hypothetical protein
MYRSGTQRGVIRELFSRKLSASQPRERSSFRDAEQHFLLLFLGKAKYLYWVNLWKNPLRRGSGVEQPSTRQNNPSEKDDYY